MYAYGVNRFSDTKRNLKSDDGVETLFSNGRPLINFEEWLLQLEIVKQDKKQRSRAHKRIEKIKEILKSNDLFPEISDYSVSFDDDMNSSVKFKTPNGDFHIHELGYGYQCRQRHVLKDLCQLFPATQIIVTTHSPLVIQSADSMNLYILKNENGMTISKSYDYSTFQGWSVEEILGELMDLGPNLLRFEQYRPV